jgi:transcriptional regulator with XRE-family HTH domain
MQENSEKFFASNLAFLMNREKVSQGHLAFSVGVTQAAVSNYLNGRIPQSGTLLKISEFFGVPADDLINRDITPWSEELVAEVYGHQIKRKFEELQRRLATLPKEEALSVLCLFFDLMDCLDFARTGKKKRKK